MAFITLVQPGEQPQTRELTRAIVIGRGDDCDWIVPCRRLSRRHLLIQREDAGWEACDLNSTNGTFVDGQQATQHSLLDGDELNIGSLTLFFTLDGNLAGDARSEDEVTALRAVVPVEALENEESANIRLKTISPAQGRPAADSALDGPPARPWSLRREADQRLGWETILAPAHDDNTEPGAWLRDRLESISSIWQGLALKRRRQGLVAVAAALLLVPLMIFGVSSPRLPPSKVDPAMLDHAAAPPKPAAVIAEQPV